MFEKYERLPPKTETETPVIGAGHYKSPRPVPKESELLAEMMNKLNDPFAHTRKNLREAHQLLIAIQV